MSTCKVQTLRQLSLDAILCIILEVFNHRKERLAAGGIFPESGKVETADEEADMTIDETDVDENWSGTVWQYTVLAPFSDQLKSCHASNKLQTLKGMERIIQTCG